MRCSNRVSCGYIWTYLIWTILTRVGDIVVKTTVALCVTRGGIVVTVTWYFFTDWPATYEAVPKARTRVTIVLIGVVVAG